MKEDNTKASAWIDGHLSELFCDECETHIGYVRDFDMQGNYVFCDSCVAKAKSKSADNG